MTQFDFIETPENVELQRRLAGIGSRFIAGLLDSLAIVLILLVLLVIYLVLAWAGLVAGVAFSWDMQAWIAALFVIAVFLVFWGYFVFWEMRTNGQSIGKKVMKLRVVKDGGGAITFLDVAVRNLIRIADLIGLYGAAGICMFLTKKGQRLGDLAAGTVVVSEAAADYAARRDHRVPAHLIYDVSAEALRATTLDPQEYRALWSYWIRREELSLEARERLLRNLIRPILLRAGKIPPNEALVAMEDHVELLLARGVAAERPTAAVAARSAAPPPPPPPPLPAAPAESQAAPQATPTPSRVAGLSAEEHRTVMDYWSRRSALSLENRVRILSEQVGPILKRQGLVPPGAPLQTIRERLKAMMEEAGPDASPTGVPPRGREGEP